MGINLNCVHLLSNTLNKIGSLQERSEKTVLTLGVQDCYFTYDSLAAFFHRHNIPYKSVTESDILYNTGFPFSETLRKRYSHNIHQITMFEMLGFKRENIKSMDVMDLEGANYVHDLNNPVDHKLHDQFDLILDAGTSEHIFGLKEAFMNLIAMTRINGFIVHFNPSDLINHGFYNMTAELYESTYRVNGFDVEEIKYIFFPTDLKDMERFYIAYDWLKVSNLMQPYYTLAAWGSFRKRENVLFRVPLQGENNSKSELNLVHGENGLVIGRWNRPGSFTGWLINQIDKSMVLSFWLRSSYQLRRGHRVNL
jgi:hypothetical protein